MIGVHYYILFPYQQKIPSNLLDLASYYTFYVSLNHFVRLICKGFRVALLKNIKIKTRFRNYSREGNNMSNYGNQVILEMARFLRENPSATVNQLAEHMGWAESRSVYYWLNQSGYKGIREFRAAALDRSVPFGEENHILRDNPIQTYIPIVRHIASPKHYEYATEDFLCLVETSNKAFAYLITDSLWAPFLIAGDLLVIDPDVKPKEQDLFLAWVRGYGTLILRMIAENCIVKDPYACEVLKDRPFNIIGSVVLLYRYKQKLS